MRKGSVLLAIFVFSGTLTMSSWGAEAPKSGKAQPPTQKITAPPATQKVTVDGKEIKPDLFNKSIERVEITMINQRDYTFKLMVTVGNKNKGSYSGPFSVRVEKRKETCPLPKTSNNYVYCDYTPWEVMSTYTISGLTDEKGTTFPEIFTDIWSDNFTFPVGASTTLGLALWNFRVTVDSGQAVNESNESNNVGTLMYIY